jgi:nucleoid DNA-binding protein
MASQTGAEMLAKRLGTEREDALRLLDRFAGAMSAELLGSGRLVVDGLGTFSVVHDHAAREATGTGAMFMPPKNRIAFDPRLTSKGDASRIAAERLSMEAGEAKALAKAVAEVFGELRTRSADLELVGFGSFSDQGGNWLFRPDDQLGELLNSVYEGLKGIRMNDGLSAPAAGGMNYLKPAGIAAVLLLLGSGLYLALRQVPLGGAGSRAASVLSVPSAAAIPPSALPAKAAGPDSVMLGKGRFTVIAATFSSPKAASAEARRLTGLGHRIMIWPVHDGGRRYYRLVTGDFQGYREARDSLRGMPPGLSKNVYIQQALKNVFIYGENAL